MGENGRECEMMGERESRRRETGTKRDEMGTGGRDAPAGQHSIDAPQRGQAKALTVLL